MTKDEGPRDEAAQSSARVEASPSNDAGAVSISGDPNIDDLVRKIDLLQEQITEMQLWVQKCPRKDTSAGADKDSLPKPNPFRYPNIVLYLGCFSLWLWFATVIISDYRRQRSDPPAVVELVNDAQQKMPGVFVCVFDAGVTIEALAHTKTSWDEPTYHSMVHPQCTGNDIARSLTSCVMLNDTIEAFNTTDDCLERVTLTVGLVLNTTAYSPDVYALGASGFLYDTEQRQQVVDHVCSERLAFLDCAAMSIDETECNLPSQTDIALSSGAITSLSLRRIETEDKLCGRHDTTWDISPTTYKLNPLWVETYSIFDSYGSSNVDDYAILSISVKSAVLRRISYTPMSWQTMFGSIAGWFGALSDGWGIVTVILMLEGFYLTIPARGT